MGKAPPRLNLLMFSNQPEGLGSFRQEHPLSSVAVELTSSPLEE